MAAITRPLSSTANTPSTPHQRLYTRTLLRELELPVNQVTIMHRDLFAAAGVDWRDGASMDATLEGLTRAQASRLIDKLRERGDHDE